MIGRIGVGVCLFDASDRLVLWNEAFRRLCPDPEPALNAGLPLAALLHQFLEAALPPEDLPVLPTRLAAGLAGQRTHGGTVVHRCRDGRRLKVEAVRLDDGALLNLWTDLPTEPGPDASAARAVVRSTRDTVITFGRADGLITAVNRAAEAMFGVPAERMAGTPVAGLFDPAAPLAPAFLARLAAGEFPEVRARRADGSPFDVEVSVAGERDGAACTLMLRDISARRRAEAALIQGERRFRDLIEGSVQGILIHRDFRPLFANEAFARMNGFDSVGELLGLPSIKVLIPSDQWPTARDHYGKLMSGERRSTIRRVANHRKGGGLLWVDLIERVIDWMGAPAVQVTLIDVTNQVLAETSAAEKSAALVSAFDAMPNGICMFDADLRVVMYNRRYLEVWGLPEEAMAARPTLPDLIRMTAANGDDPEAAVAAAMEFLRSSRDLYEVRHLADGRVLEVQGSRRADGGYVFAYLDITGRRRTEEALRRSEEIIRHLLETSPVGVYTATPEGRVLYTNPRGAEMLGITREELYRTDAHNFYARPEQREEMLRTLRRDGVVRNYGLEWRRKDGEPLWVVLFVEPTEVDGRAAVISWVVDITSRKRAEEELERKSTLLRAALENMGQGIVMVVSRSRLAAYNRRWTEMFDLPPDLLAHEPDWDRIIRFRAERGDYGPGDPEELAVAKIAESMERANDARTFETHRPDGRYLEIRTMPLAGGGFVRTYTDITERRLAEQALRENREILNGVIDAIPAVINVKDRQSRYLLVNRFQREQIGLSREDALGKTPADLAGPVVADHYRSLDQAVIETGAGIPFFEELVPDPQGTPRYWLATKRPLFDAAGQVSHIVTVALDITERKRAEEEVARQSNLLRVILESISQGLTAFDGEQRLIAWNRRALDLLAMPAEVFEHGRPFVDLVRYRAMRGDYGPGDVDEQIRERIDRFRDPPPHRFEWIRFDGVTLEVQGMPRPGGGFVTTFTDVSARKRAEEEVRAAKERAERTLQELRETQKSLIQAEKMAALGSLVAGVAHEINTPVGITLTAASHLAQETGAIRALFEEGRIRKADFAVFIDLATETTKLMVANIHRAAELIQSFKLVAVDQTSAERRPFDLKEYVHEVLLSLQPRLKKTQLRLEVDLPPHLELDSYPGALSQVLSNLVINSLTHAYDDGQGGCLTIGARRLPGDWIELRFSDDGRGIPARHLPKIFDPFFTTKRGAGGSGLGLNIVYNIVTQTMKGHIAVESAEGQGTVFTLRFPQVVPNTENGEEKTWATV